MSTKAPDPSDPKYDNTPNQFVMDAMTYEGQQRLFPAAPAPRTTKRFEHLADTHFLQDLPDHDSGFDAARYYWLNELKAIPRLTVEEPLKGVYLAITPSDQHWVSFAVFEWAYEEATDGIALSLVCVGEGTGEPLRELRHTYWAGDGYLFYMPLDKVIAALTALKKYFNPE